MSGNRPQNSPEPWGYVVGFVVVDFNLSREAGGGERNGRIN
jgi:hypothetical protein